MSKWVAVFQLKNDRDSREKEQFRLERCLQSCTLDLTMETESVKESRSRERVAVRRLTAAVDREKQERKKSSLKYSKEILEHKRAVDKLMVELQSEKKDRASDAKSKMSYVLSICPPLITLLRHRLGNSR